MYYDFEKKEAVDALASVTHFVDHNNALRKDIKPSKCKIVKLFTNNSNGGNLFVAKPIELLGKVCIRECNQKDYCGGTMYINGNTHTFSIHDEVLYIGQPR